VILNRGHDISADYWSLGVLMFELLTGMHGHVALCGLLPITPDLVSACFGQQLHS
jgi:serine/threonine protein kinase